MKSMLKQFIISSDENYIDDRKTKREEIKRLNPYTDKTKINNLKKDIIDSQIKEKNDKIDKLNQQKNEIKETYYMLVKKLIGTYKRLGIIRSQRDLCRLMNKSNNYFVSSELQNNMPSMNIITEIAFNIDKVGNILEETKDDLINKRSAINILNSIKDRFLELKLKIIKDLIL